MQAHLSVYDNSVYAVAYSKQLVLFKAQVLGLETGRKTRLELPTPIIKQGKTSLAGLVSGLYDADCSVKIRKTKSGIYPRISIVKNGRKSWSR